MNMVLLVIIFILIAVAVAVVVIRLMRKYDLSKMPRQEGDEESKVTFRDLLGNLYMFIPAMFGTLKYVYEAWQNAPAGSPEKLKWGLVLAVIAVAVFRVGLLLVDRQINRERAQEFSYNPEAAEIEKQENG